MTWSMAALLALFALACAQPPREELLANAVAHATWGDCDRASDLLSRAAAEQPLPDDPQLAASQALCLESSGRLVEARQRFEAACRMLAEWDGKGAAAILRRSPEYPPDAVRWRDEGGVELRLNLDADGRVLKVSVEESSGFDELDAAAVEAAAHWRYCVEEGSQGGVKRVRLHFEVKD